MRFFLLLGLLLGLGSCGTSKKVTTPALVNHSVIIPQVDSSSMLKLTSRDSLISDSLAAVDTVAEDILVVQKRLGIEKLADWAPAMHYDLRKPNFVIIHHTSQTSVAQTIRTFQVPHSKVSSHYVIGRNGQLIQMLNDYDRAWHAGRSKWGAITDMNSMSIGIELDNNGREPFAEAQINTLLVLLDTLKSKYLIPQLNFIGHSDIAPSRKDDPNVLFPWKKLAERGFGVWYNENFLMDPPANFNAIDALKIIGYDMSKPESAIRAFKRKYVVKEVNGILTDYDKKVLYDLYRKYY